MVELMNLVEKENITLIETNLCNRGVEGLKGLYFDNHIYLCDSIKSVSEKRCILAEELGHHYTSHGNIIDQSKVVNVKVENLGRKWAFEKLVPLESLILASKQGVRSHYELAEHLCVTEKFLNDAIRHYRSKYGLTHRLGRYIMYFEPLAVLELLEDL